MYINTWYVLVQKTIVRAKVHPSLAGSGWAGCLLLFLCARPWRPKCRRQMKCRSCRWKANVANRIDDGGGVFPLAPLELHSRL